MGVVRLKNNPWWFACSEWMLYKIYDGHHWLTHRCIFIFFSDRLPAAAAAAVKSVLGANLMVVWSVHRWFYSVTAHRRQVVVDAATAISSQAVWPHTHTDTQARMGTTGVDVLPPPTPTTKSSWARASSVTAAGVLLLIATLSGATIAAAATLPFHADAHIAKGTAAASRPSLPPSSTSGPAAAESLNERNSLAPMHRLSINRRTSTYIRYGIYPKVNSRYFFSL